jgi:hypothetical protein
MVTDLGVRYLWNITMDGEETMVELGTEVTVESI